jgi:hypothetical protein
MAQSSRKTICLAEISLLLLIIFVVPLSGQKADRAIITGVVTDSTGAAVPQCRVTITEEATNVETIVSTNDVGNYSTPPLVLGLYTVKVEKEGFKTFVRSGIPLQGGAVFRQDASLQVGEVSQTVEVNVATEMLNVQTPEVAALVNERYYHDLPVIVASEMRLPESLLYLEPGFVPLKPTNTFPSGTQFQSRINGGQRAGLENYLDGASYGEVSGHNQTQERSVPYEAVKELKVISSSLSPQYGRTSGGLVEYTTKSGTSQLHGSAYWYVNNDILNALGAIPVSATSVPALRQNSFGATVGGPVYIPKVYTKKKTFFFFNWDEMHFRRGVLPSYDLTVPTSAFRQGDFSALLNPKNQIGTDALGRPIVEGQLFDPATTRTVNGVPVRDPFVGNIIPSNNPLRSSIAAKLTSMIPAPDIPGIIGNSALYSNDSSLNVHTILARIDHEFSPRHRMSSTFNYNDRPRITNCNGPGGCAPGLSNPDTYVGPGIRQQITTKLFHLQFDSVIRPNIFNHVTAAYDRWIIPSTALGQGNWADRVGLKGLPDPVGGPPGINFSGTVPYSALGSPAGENSAYATDRIQFLDDLSWIKGKHTLKMGFEYRHHIIPYFMKNNRTGTYNFSFRETGGYDSAGNLLSKTGDPFASFLLGQVDNSTFTIDSQPQYSEDYFAPWFNDEFKVTSKLTVNIGLRFDYQTSIVEKYDRISSFDPTVPNPGAGGLPGAMVFAGTGPGLVGRRTFGDPPHDAFGPRVGVAYQATSKDVIRGGYGIYYAGVMQQQFVSNPTLGFESNPTAPNLTNGLAPAFLWDNGFPQNLIHQPPFIDPTVGNGQGADLFNPEGYKLPRFQNWSMSVQHQISDNMLLDISYIGSHGTRLVNSGSSLGPLANMNDPSVLALGPSILQSTDFNDPAVIAAGIEKPYDGFVGNVAQALRPWPQMQGITYYPMVPNGTSVYHALEVKLEKRFSRGLQGRVAYTWSKFINTAEHNESGGNSGPQNPIDFAAERSLSVDQLPQSLLIGFTYELPVGPGKRFADVNGPIGKILGGWKAAGLLRYQSGRPLAITMANDLGGLLFNSTKRPNKVGGGVGETDIGKFAPGQDGSLYLLSSGWADPGPLQFGNASRTDPVIRGFPFYREDFNLIKDTKIYADRLILRFEANFANLFNRHTWCDPDTDFSSSSFGHAFGQCDDPRRIQFGLKLEW